jgi:hypothetical protein
MPVDELHRDYKENADEWEMIRDMLAGAKAVRNGGEKYLPRLSDMSYGEYNAYKNRAQFFNATQRTLTGLAGMISRKPAVITLGDAESLRPLLDNCTSDNQSFTIFIRNIIREVLGMGRIGAFVDAPSSGGNPYFVSYSTENITNWRTTLMAGKDIPDQIILKENIIVPADDGFGSEYIGRYRELVLLDGVYTQRIWVPLKALNGKITYGISNIAQPMIPGMGYFRNEIPFVTFGPHNLTLDIQRSPILDIAELNKLHFQTSAQLAHGRFYTATPTYWAMMPVSDNGSNTPVYRVGPNTVWLVDTPNACGILEYKGEGLKYLENACSQLEQQMAGLGARLVSDRKNTAGESKDVADLRQKGETSVLFEIVDNIEMGLTELLKVWVRWHGRNPSGVAVQLNRDFVGSPLEYRHWLQLDRAHEKGVIDDETYYRMLFEGEVLPSNYTMEDVDNLIQNAKTNRRERVLETQELEANTNAGNPPQTR